METKGIEEMTKKELIDLVNSQNKELKDIQNELSLYTKWYKEEKDARILLQDKINTFKNLAKII